MGVRLDGIREEDSRLDSAMIIADTRWAGQNGIGRYANEVLSRLTVTWSPIAPSGSPSSPNDFLTKRVSVGGIKPAAIYSPGYNGFLRNVPQTITVHDLIHLEGPSATKYRPYYNLFLKPLIRKQRHVLTVSETSKRNLERWIDDSNVRVINAGNGSSPSFMTSGARFQSLIPYYLYVGNLRAHKNVETVMEALSYLKDGNLHIVTKDRRAAEILAAKHGVSQRVRIFSDLNDDALAEMYRGARATVQPSLIEGFGLPALEAALCGSPVIFYNGCESVREICAGGGRAVGVANDAREWAAQMSAVAEDEKFPDGVVLAEKYSWESVSQAVSTTLKSVSEPHESDL
jgi:glycosyltransferase involved in cell wall biosynthesis